MTHPLHDLTNAVYEAREEGYKQARDEAGEQIALLVASKDAMAAVIVRLQEEGDALAQAVTDYMVDSARGDLREEVERWWKLRPEIPQGQP
jgi:hypothetical protein